MIKKILTIGVASLLFFQCAKAQDLFNYNNSLRYAKHLYAKGDFKDAIPELNRCIFLSVEQARKDVLEMLLISHRKTGQFTEILQASKNSYPLGNFPDLVLTELHYSFILSNELEFGSHFLVQNQFSSQVGQVKFSVAYDVFQNQYRSALERLSVYVPVTDEGKVFRQQATILLNDADGLKYKSPLVAGLLSAVIPGSGKFYAKRKKDAIFSFVLTMAAAYQSYRAFNKNGVGSVIGWVYGGLAGGFYVGNIYGSVQAAKQTNKFTNERYHDQMRTIIGI